MRLDVGVLGAEEFLGAIDRDLLGLIDELATAVVALAGVPLGILVGQNRTLSLEHRLADEILRSDELEVVLLALGFVFDGCSNLRVEIIENIGHGCENLHESVVRSV